MGIVEEMMWSKRLGELENLLVNAQVVDLEEQNEIAGLGTGVILEYEDRNISKFILEGFSVEVLEGRVSIHSPLGKAILGAKEGEKRIFRVGENKRIVTIKRILPPSLAETIFQDEKIGGDLDEK